jgi:CheY-like chemotaxis protein
MARITVVNDNPDFLELVREILEGDRYDTTTVDGDEPTAIDAVRASRPDLIMIDLRMGSDELHGWDIAQQVRRDPAMTHLPMLICSADLRALQELESELEQVHAVKTLVKPFPIDALTEAIDDLLRASTAR